MRSKEVKLIAKAESVSDEAEEFDSDAIFEGLTSEED